MPKPKYPFDPAAASRIVAWLELGAFDHTACESEGIPYDTFLGWLQMGRSPRARPPFRDFARRVMQAAASARRRAEQKLYEEEPKVWLTKGPGKDVPGRAGWSKEVSSQPPSTIVNVAQMGADLSRLLAVLSQFPEARAAVVAELQAEAGQRPPALEITPPTGSP